MHMSVVRGQVLRYILYRWIVDRLHVETVIVYMCGTMVCYSGDCVHVWDDGMLQRYTKGNARARWCCVCVVGVPGDVGVGIVFMLW